MFRTSQKYLWIKTSGADCFHPYGNIIISTIQPCRYKSANLNSRNYYELLGVEKTATQKEIKQAFFKLSKEYHPDSNSADKSLHAKFVKINEAFGILSKQSTRLTYDQSLNSLSRHPDWSNVNFGSRGAYQRNASESHWNTSSQSDKTFYEMYRRRMEQDRQRFNTHSYYYSTPHSFQSTYFAPFSVILIIVGFGMFIHALQWRIMRFSDPQYAVDPRSRHYRAYREWQQMSALKDAESMSPIRRKSSSSLANEEDDDDDDDDDDE